MGEIAEAMLDGTMCAGCGEYLDSEDAQEMGIPMFCTDECAKDHGSSADQSVEVFKK